MTSEDARLSLLYALRRLGEDARQAAAGCGAKSREHDFYAGVGEAVKDRLHPEAALDHDKRLRYETAGFREGYAKTVALIGAATTEPPTRLLLPEPDSPA